MPPPFPPGTTTSAVELPSKTSAMLPVFSPPPLTVWPPPPSPPEWVTIAKKNAVSEVRACYAVRYKDVFFSLCDGLLSQCQWPAIALHMQTYGLIEHRNLGCQPPPTEWMSGKWYQGDTSQKAAPKTDGSVPAVSHVVAAQVPEAERPQSADIVASSGSSRISASPALLTPRASRVVFGVVVLLILGVLLPLFARKLLCAVRGNKGDQLLPQTEWSNVSAARQEASASASVVGGAVGLRSGSRWHQVVVIDDDDVEGCSRQTDTAGGEPEEGTAAINRAGEDAGERSACEVSEQEAGACDSAGERMLADATKQDDGLGDAVPFSACCRAEGGGADDAAADGSASSDRDLYF